DVIYFDATDTSLEKEKQLETKLEFLLPDQPWSVKNQARMHLKSGFKSFTSSYDGGAHFHQTPTALAFRLSTRAFELMAPFGLDYLFEIKFTPNLFNQEDNELH